jgi:hypothetical protein
MDGQFVVQFARNSAEEDGWMVEMQPCMLCPHNLPH